MSTFVPGRTVLTVLVLAASLTGTATARAGQLTPGNLVVTVNDFTGYENPPVYLAEYQTNGTRVQTLSTIPTPPDNNSLQQATGTVVSPDGKTVYVYNTAADQQPYLASYNVASGNWSQQTTTGWTGASSTIDGGVGVYGNYVFASNASYTDGGLLRFSTTSSNVDHFGPSTTNLDIINLTVNSGTGIIYAIDNQSHVYEYSATTLQLLHTFSASESFGLNEVVAGAADGSVYVASQQGEIFHYSASGMLLNELNVTTTSFTGHQVGAFFDSIAINDQTGQIALGSADYGRVFVTDLGLDTVSSFQATDATSNFFSGNVDVAWVPAASAVPEPPAIMMVGIAAVVLAASSRVRGAVWGR